MFREQHEQGRSAARARTQETQGEQGGIPHTRPVKLWLPPPQQTFLADVRWFPASDVPQEFPRPLPPLPALPPDQLPLSVLGPVQQFPLLPLQC